MKSLWIFLAAILLFTGCAAAKTAVSDYQLGQSAPLVEGETSPAAQAKIIEDTAAVIPGVGAFSPAIGFLAMTFLTYLRGRNIRKGQPTSTVPATGFMGNQLGIEFVVQKIATVAAGLFEVGPDGSPVKRGWKTALTSLAGLVGVALLFPDVQAYLLANPQIPAVITGISGIFGALEKQLSIVKPVVNPTEPSVKL